MAQPKTKLATQVGLPLVFIADALDYQCHFTHFFFCLCSKISQRSGEENRKGGLWHHQPQ